MKSAALLVVAALSLAACGKSSKAPAVDDANGAGDWGGMVPKNVDPVGAPQGMAEIAKAGTGRVFSTELGGSKSAAKLMQGLIMGVSDYFDTAPHIQGAVRDGKDRHAEAAFWASLRTVPVRGILVVDAAGNGGRGIMIVDYADRLPKSFAKLRGGAGVGAPSVSGGGPAIPPLTRVNIPDGSGQIGIAPGWRLRAAAQGAVDIDGPRGAYLGLAGRSLLTTAQYAQMFPTMPYVSSLDPVRGLQEVTAQSQRLGGPPTQVQILHAEPIQWQNGQAALIRFRARTPQQTLETFGLYALMQTDVSQIVSYYSFVSAPPGVFDEIYPTALAMWGSWSANPAFLTKRLMEAAQTQRSTNDTITSGYEDRQRRQDNVNQAWDQYIRGTTTMESVENGVRVREDLNRDFAQQWIKEFPNDYREVPLQELNPR